MGIEDFVSCNPQIMTARGSEGAVKAGASLGGVMVQNTKENGAKASAVVICHCYEAKNLDVQGKLTEWASIHSLEVKEHMKASGETGKHMVLENLQVQLVKR